MKTAKDYLAHGPVVKDKRKTPKVRDINDLPAQESMRAGTGRRLRGGNVRPVGIVGLIKKFDGKHVNDLMSHISKIVDKRTYEGQMFADIVQYSCTKSWRGFSLDANGIIHYKQPKFKHRNTYSKPLRGDGPEFHFLEGFWYLVLFQEQPRFDLLTHSWTPFYAGVRNYVWHSGLREMIDEGWIITPKFAFFKRRLNKKEIENAGLRGD